MHPYTKKRISIKMATVMNVINFFINNVVNMPLPSEMRDTKKRAASLNVKNKMNFTTKTTTTTAIGLINEVTRQREIRDELSEPKEKWNYHMN